MHSVVGRACPVPRPALPGIREMGMRAGARPADAIAPPLRARAHAPHSVVGDGLVPSRARRTDAAGRRIGGRRQASALRALRRRNVNAELSSGRFADETDRFVQLRIGHVGGRAQPEHWAAVVGEYPAFSQSGGELVGPRGFQR